jgi:hypothetical protein
MIDATIERMIPKGWMWTIYGPSGERPARAVLVSPDWKIHIGREGKDGGQALVSAAMAAKQGARS